MPGQWLDDPTRRYRKRWHDGTAWTEFVTDDGPASIDPIGAPPPPPPSQPWAYGQPGTYPTYAGAPPYFPPQKGTNGFAVASLVLGILWLYFVGSILAVIFGHIAISQVGRDGGHGKGLAIAGLVLGYIGVAILAIAVVALAADG